MRKMIVSFLMVIALMLSSVGPVGAEGPLVGKATWYQCTKGWCDGTPTVALAGFLGGRYTGHVNGWVEVCEDHCVVLPVVDYCQCYAGTADQRIVDLNKAAWKLVTDKPYSRGKITVTMTIGIPQPGIDDMPNTAMEQP